MYKLIETKKDVAGLKLSDHYSIFKLLNKGNSHFIVHDIDTNEKLLEVKVGDNELWYVSNRARRYIASVEPLTGKNKKCIHIEKAEANIYEPQFYKDKIFVNDANYNLYVYQM